MTAKIPILALTVAVLVCTASETASVSAQQKSQQAQSSEQPGPARFFRRLREEIRGTTEQEKAEQQRQAAIAKQKELAARGQAVRGGGAPTPATRPAVPGVNPYQGRFEGVRVPPSSGGINPPAAANLVDPDAGYGANEPTPALRPTDFAAVDAPTPASGSGGSGFGMTLEQSGEKIVIHAIAGGSNAQTAGLKRGDTIQSVGGVAIRNVTEFDEIAGVMAAGDQIELEIGRGGKEEKILLQYGQAPASETAGNEAPGEASLAEGNALTGPPLTGNLVPPPLNPSSSIADFVPNDRSSAGGLQGQQVGSGRSVIQPGARQGQQSHDPVVANQAQTIVKLQQTVEQQQALIQQLQQQLQASQDASRRRN